MMMQAVPAHLDVARSLCLFVFIIWVYPAGTAKPFKMSFGEGADVDGPNEIEPGV